MKTWPAKELVRNKQTQSDLSVSYKVPGPKSTTPPSVPLERNTHSNPWKIIENVLARAMHTVSKLSFDFITFHYSMLANSMSL